MKTRRIILFFTVFSLLFCMIFPVSALNITDLNWESKIAEGIYEQSAQKEDKYLVSIRLNDISKSTINAEVLKKTGYEVEKYEDAKRHNAEVVPEIKQQVLTALNNDTQIQVLSNQELDLIQQEAITEDYNQFIAAKRAIMGNLYEKQTQDFVHKNVSATNEILFQGEYLPLVILYATQSEIEAYAKNSNVTAITPFANAVAVNHSIEEMQIQADRSGGTKCSSYNYGSGYTGAGVKIGVLEAECGRFDPTDPQLSAIVGTDPYNPNGKKLFFIENVCPPYPVTEVVTSHATAITSLIVGQEYSFLGTTYEGIAPDATVYQIPFESEVNMVFAMESMIAMNVSIINISAGFMNVNQYQTVDSAIDDVVSSYGITVVAAAGNYSNELEDFTLPWIGSIGKAYNAITVGCVETKTNFNTAANTPYSMWNYSCYSEPDYLANKPDLVAPGANFVVFRDSTDEELYVTSGTSFSAPLVAGVVAQLHQAVPSLASNPAATKAILLTGANYSVMSDSYELVDSTRCNYIWEKYGVGMLDARRAVEIALANNFTAISRSIANLSDGGQDSLGSIVGQNDVKIRVVLVYDNVQTTPITNSGYGNNIDLHLKCAGSTYASSTMLYNNVEVIEYTFACFDVYDFYTVYTAIDETLSSKTMKVAIAWDMSVVA